jgi:hypothetical protein
MEKNYDFLKNKLKSSHYRTLSYINNQKFPVNVEKTPNKREFNRFLTILVKSGMNLDEISENLKQASLGKTNEFSEVIVKNPISDETNFINNSSLVLLGALCTLCTINIFL